MIVDRFLEIINPKDRIRFDDVKDNQLVWYIQDISYKDEALYLARWEASPKNPYQVFWQVSVINGGERNNIYSPVAIGKDKLYFLTFYTATEVSLTLMGLQYKLYIPGEINAVELIEKEKSKYAPRS